MITPSQNTTSSSAHIPENITSKNQTEVEDSDQYQDAKLSEKSEESDSSTPHLVDNDGEDNSLSLLPPSSSDILDGVGWASSATEDHGSGLTSKSSHHYYNSSAKQLDNTYYNNSAIAAANNDDTIRIDPNDYESMYSIKRDLESLREASSRTSEKIDALGSSSSKYGE